MITFGFELEMLTLHMRVMQPEVAGFLVAEATSTFQAVNQADLTRSKPAVLSEALGNGTFPLDLARLLTVLRSNSYATMQSCKRVRAHNPAHYPLTIHTHQQRVRDHLFPSEQVLRLYYPLQVRVLHAAVEVPRCKAMREARVVGPHGCWEARHRQVLLRCCSLFCGKGLL